VTLAITIKDMKALNDLLKQGYILKGPRKSSVENLKAIEMYFNRNRCFYSEDWLLEQGYEFVEPSAFSKGLKFAFKLRDNFPDKYFKSNYSLVREDKEVALYLKYEDKHL
jgi:hypothetical protein